MTFIRLAWEPLLLFRKDNPSIGAGGIYHRIFALPLIMEKFRPFDNYILIITRD